MPLLILDRDGVINHDSSNYIRSLNDWKPIEGSLEAIAKASNAGWTVAIATNQSGLARGYFNQATLGQIHQRLRDQVAALGGHIDAIAYCPHGPDDGCDCRKPAPGMLNDLMHSFGESDAYFVGDSLRDLQAAERADVKPILVLTGNGNKTAQHADMPAAVDSYPNLASAVDAIL